MTGQSFGGLPSVSIPSDMQFSDLHILQEATVVGWQLSLRLDSVFEISNRHHSGSECVATGAGIASFCG